MYQHDSQIDRDDGLKEEGFEVVGHVRDHDQEDGWDVHGEDGAQQSPGKCHLNNYRWCCLDKFLASRDLTLAEKNFEKSLPAQNNRHFNIPQIALCHTCLSENYILQFYTY